jgi:hypothetical protein
MNEGNGSKILDRMMRFNEANWYGDLNCVFDFDRMACIQCSEAVCTF